MMIVEALGLLALLFILGLIGIGPALWVVAAGEKRLAYALGIAPTLGQAIIGIIGFPLVRYVAPVEAWAVPVTVALVSISAVAIVRDWRHNQAAYQAIAARPTVLRIGCYGLVCYLVLVGPLVVRGIQYAAFRANPSDAFVNMSLSETLRVANWKTILGGAEMSGSNLEGLRRLAGASPTAIFSARLILLPLALNKMAALSWAAEILRLPVYRFYYAHNLTSFALAFLMTLVIGDQARLSRLLKYLAAAAVAFGFWAKFVLESDAAYEMATIPILLLAVFAWIQLEQGPNKALCRSRVLLALALATLVSFYFPVVPIIVGAFGCYYGMGWLQRAKDLSAGLYHGFTVALTALILSMSGQIDFSYRNSAALVFRVGNERAFPPIVLRLIKADDVSAVWGLPGSLLWERLPTVARLPLRSIGTGLGLFLTGALAGAAVFVARKSAPVSERILFAMLVGGAILSIVSFTLLDNPRAAGKSFTYVYPYLILSVAIFSKYMDALFKPPLYKAAFASLGLWLGSQFGLGLYLPYHDLMVDVMGGAPKPENYDLSPITEYLDAHPPALLLVVVPRAGIWSYAAPGPWYSEEWTFAYYSMLAFARYRPYFQSGLIGDNTVQAQNMWLQNMARIPDYAVILKSVDYVGPRHLGVKVAETADLALYRITTGEMLTFQKEERRLFEEREREADCIRGVCSVPGVPQG